MPLKQVYLRSSRMQQISALIVENEHLNSQLRKVSAIFLLYTVSQKKPDPYDLLA